jgi:hypothetical protein
VTRIKFKILSGFVLVVGVTINSPIIATSFVGRIDGTYGFGC